MLFPTGTPIQIVAAPTPRSASETSLRQFDVDLSPSERAERAELLMREVVHRAKNMFAVIIAISRHLGKTKCDFKCFQEAFEERLQGLAATYFALEDRDKSPASVRDLLKSHLALLGDDGEARVRIDGPQLALPRHQMEHLGLAIHELTTNALKHGALSVQDGIVSVHWSANGGVFRLDWTESGGPPVSMPKSKGFGSTILERVVPTAFGGTAALCYAPGGIVWHLEAPLSVIHRSDLGRKNRPAAALARAVR